MSFKVRFNPFVCPACVNDAVSLKHATAGRVTVDVHVQANFEVCACGTVRCKTSEHVFQGRSFMSKCN